MNGILAAMRKVLAIVLMAWSLATYAAGQQSAQLTSADSAFMRKSWVKQLMSNRFNINDPRISYPKFAGFCVKVYNWGDRTFNSYNPEYVVGTGKNWKLFAHNDAWMQNYALMFKKGEYIRMRSDVYDDLGANISFMAVSLGYSVNARTLFRNTRENRKRFNFNFVCALFSINYRHSSTIGGVKITHFGDFEPVDKHPYNFNAISSKSTSLDMYYFFNHRKYSHAAAYCYSKYQLKSADTWIIGATYNNQNINIDFSSLPQEMLNYLPVDQKYYKFHYRDFGISGGYGHNWVLSPRKWLINLTVMPSIGLRNSYEDATEHRKYMVSANMRVMTSVVYNHRSLYTALYGNALLHFYFGNNYTFVNTSELLYLTVGMRF